MSEEIAPTPFNNWFDPSAPEVAFTHAEFMVRLKEVHGIDPATTKGQRSMSYHIDSDTYFDWGYNWEIGGKKFVQQTRTMRSRAFGR